MNLLIWAVLGLVAGAIAKWIMPGGDPGGLVVTMIIGILGAIIGGFVSRPIFGVEATGLNVTSLVVAIVGAIILLAIYRFVRSKM